jgi:hypothetical protein
MRYLKNNFQGKRGERIPSDLINTLANFWNDLTVLGGSLRRRSDGRNTVIEINPAVTDTDGFDLAKDPDGRQTIQHNPEDYADDPDSHSNELQLHNVHMVKDGSHSMPFFVSSQPLQGDVPDKVVGELYWATVDSDRKADNAELVYRSLDIEDTHSTGNKGRFAFSLYGFTGSDISHVPYAKLVTNPAGNGRELEWRWPVTCQVATSQQPCNATPVNNEVISSLPVGTATGSYTTVTPSIRNLTVDRASLAIGSEAGGTTCYLPVTVDWSELDPSIIPHALLDFTNESSQGGGGQNWDHDARYLRIDASWSGAQPGCDNTTTGIAHDTAGKAAIEFSTAYLYDRGTAPQKSICYGDRELWKRDATGPCASWQLSAFFGDWAVSGGFKAGWNAATSTIAYSSHAFYSSGFDVLSETKNGGGLLCKSDPAAGFNYFNVNGTGSAAFARFGTDSGSDRVNIMDVVDGVNRTLALKAADGTLQAVADGTNKYVYLNQVRLMVGNSLTNWIELSAVPGQLTIVDQDGAALARFTTGEP